MFCMLRKQKYVLLNSNHEKRVILLMISNGEKLWHYLVVKNLLALLKGIISKYHGDFYCLIFFLNRKEN